MEQRRGTWFNVCFELEAEAARVVLDHDDGHRGASCPVDSVRALGYQVGSGTGDSGHRLTGFLPDPLDSFFRWEPHGRSEGR